MNMLYDDREKAKLDKLKEIQKAGIKGAVDCIAIKNECDIQFSFDESVIDSYENDNYEYVDITKLETVYLLLNDRIASIKIDDGFQENPQAFIEKLQSFLVYFADLCKTNNEIIKKAEELNIEFDAITHFPQEFNYCDKLIFFCCVIGEYARNIELPDCVKNIVITRCVKGIEDVFEYYGNTENYHFDSVVFDSPFELHIQDRCLSHWSENVENVAVKEIGERAFYGNDNIREIVIPEGVDVIGEEAFANCCNLEKVVFPKSIRYIGKKAFYNCCKLSQIESMSDDNFLSCADEKAFERCAIKNLRFSDDDKTFIENGVFVFISPRRGFHYVPGDSDDDVFALYLADVNAKNIVINESVTKIVDEAFCGCENIESITLPKGIRNIGKKAFCGCKNLCCVNDLHDAEVEEDAFKNCSIENLDGKKLKIENGFAFCVETDEDYLGEITLRKKLLYCANINKKDFTIESSSLDCSYSYVNKW